MERRQPAELASSAAPSTVGGCPPAEDAQETDLWWGAPSSRSMAPSFMLCGAMTAVIGFGAWYLYQLRPESLHWWRYGAYLLALLLWGQQIAQWSYRSVFVSYRLTSCRLRGDSGIRHPHQVVIELTQIKQVHPLPPTRRERWLRVGRVAVTASGPVSEFILYGLPDPVAVAERIRAAATQASTAANPVPRKTD